MSSPSTAGEPPRTSTPAKAGIVTARATDLVMVATAVGALLLHASHYYPFFSDDALISLRYAQRLCAGEGLTWTAGRPVEGYTDLLWVLLNAPATCVGLDPMWSARVLDFLGAAVAALVIAIPFRGGGVLSGERLATGSLLFVGSGPIAAWSIAGLEHGFMFGVLALALHFSRGADAATPRNTLRAGLLFGALALLRADGLVLFAGATLGRFATAEGRRGGVRSAVAWFAFPALFLLAQLAFRWGYYGELVPNTAVAKVSFNLHRLVQGVEHVGAGLQPLAVVLSLTALSVAALWRSHRASILPPLATALVWVAYVASVGGDIFPGWRQLSLAIVPLCLLVADGAEVMLPGLLRNGFVKGAAVIVPPLVLHTYLQLEDAENRRAKGERWEWDGLPIGTTLKQALGARRPLLAVDAAGALPYWSELPSLDMLGLNDHHIPRHPPPSFGRGVIGHELGDPEYVWEREPDLIAFCNARGSRKPCFIAGRALVRRPDFQDTYQLVRLRGPGPEPVGEIWFRREGGKVGVTREASRIVIPGYFLSQGPAVAALLGRDRLATWIGSEQPGLLERLEVPRGSWKLTTNTGAEDIRVSFACDGVSPALLDGAENVIHLHAATHLDIVAAPPPGAPELAVHTLTLTATDDPPGAACSARHGRHTVSRKLEDLAQRPGEGAHWAGPGATRLGRAGLRVDFGGTKHVEGLELSADNNDLYEVRFYRRGELAGKVTAPAHPLSGLRTRKLDEIPAEVTRDGVDSALIVGRRGDRSYSIGHVRISE